MEYRQLGRSGLRVSAVAYGNWVTHGNQLDDGAAAACVAAALDAGITTFDTADRYAQGRAEEALGKALSGVRRSSIELCTKVCLPVGPGANDAGLSRKHIIEGCHASLSRLGTDYLDLYQAHRYDDSVPLEETMLAFADLVRQGKVLYVGASEWTAPQLRAGLRLAAELHIPFIANQPQYSMLWRVVEAEVSPACADLGLGQLAWSPLRWCGWYPVWLPPALLTLAVTLTGLGSAQLWRDELATWSAATRSPGDLVRLAGTIDAATGPYYLLMHGWTDRLRRLHDRPARCRRCWP